jgi:hypothetical protein
MPWVGFEPTIPASERAKTVHALDRSATVTGPLLFIEKKNIFLQLWIEPRISTGLMLGFEFLTAVVIMTSVFGI